MERKFKNRPARIADRNHWCIWRVALPVRIAVTRDAVNQLIFSYSIKKTGYQPVFFIIAYSPFLHWAKFHCIFCAFGCKIHISRCVGKFLFAVNSPI